MLSPILATTLIGLILAWLYTNTKRSIFVIGLLFTVSNKMFLFFQKISSHKFRNATSIE